MARFSSFNVVKPVLKDADERFAPSFRPDPERVKILEQYCEAFDRLIERHDGEEFEISVDEIGMTVKISVTFTEMEVNRGVTEFAQLMERADNVRLSWYDGDHFLAEFTFPSLWESAL